MTHCLLRALMFAAIVSIGDMAFCEDQPGNQTTAQLNTQVKVQLNYLGATPFCRRGFA
jgi:hypothetical protein